jgi:glycosyltransferase involved in cell wall biosynthesis
MPCRQGEAVSEGAVPIVLNRAPGRDGPRIEDADLLRIAQAAARFPRSVPPGAPLSRADMDQIARRFGGMLAARLDGLAALAAPPRPGPPLAGPTDPGLGAALREWGQQRFAGGQDAAALLARRLGVPLETGLLAAAALPGFAALPRRDLPRLAAQEGTGGSGPETLSRFFRILALAMRLRRPDMLEAPGMDASPAALADWCIVFGLSEYRLWPLLPPADRRLLLGGTPDRPPLFLRAVLRFRWDLKALADRPLLLRQWLRTAAAGEYGIRLDPAPAPAPPIPGRISVIGPWRNVLGLSDDCFSACRALDSLGLDWEVTGTEVGRHIEADPDKLAILGPRAAAAPRGERALITDTLFQATFWALVNWQRFRAFRRVDLFAPWELPSLPEGWRLAARLLFHTIMAPSGFARDAFAASGAARALRVTSSVEVTGRRHHPAADRLALRRRLILPRGARVLVTVFDFSSWMERKNPEATLAAFARLRRQVPNTLLVVKTTRGRRARGAARRLAAALRRSPGVVWVDGAWPNADLEALLRGAAAFVSLHRAEGFGRNIAKALLLGTKAVVTDWSGNTEMGAEPGYIGVRPARLVPITDRDYVLGEGQVWAEPDTRAAVRGMRRALAAGVPKPGRAALRFGRARLARRLERAMELGATRC